jgi:hypothetical protein
MAILILAGAVAISMIAGQQAGSGTPPKVVSTHPSPGAVIAPGPLKLSVTFDRPMRPGNYSFVQKSTATYPNCGSNVPEQSPDGRTFTLACTVAPGRDYEVWFNSEPYMNFRDMSGASSIPFQLRFRTRSR